MRARWALTIAGLALVAAYMAWVAVRSPSVGGGSWAGGSPHILAALAIALVGIAVLGGGLMWLAFFSARRGFDDRADRWQDEPEDPRRGA